MWEDVRMPQDERKKECTSQWHIYHRVYPKGIL